MKNLGQINDPKDIVNKEYVDTQFTKVENSVLYTEQNLTEEQQTQARQNIGAVSEEEIIDIIESGTEPQINAVGELIDFNFEQETPITVISKINRDSSWGLSNQLTLHQVKGRNFVNLSEYVGEPGTVFEANGITAILNDNGTISVSGTNTGTGWATPIKQFISSGDIAARVYPPGTYTIPSGVTIQIRSAKYPANETIPDFSNNLEGTKTIPVPFRVYFVMYEVAKGVTVDKTIPFGLYRDKPIPTTNYEYCGNIYTATFDQPVYEGEFNWTTGELKDIDGNTIGYYKTPEIVGMEGDNHFWTGFGENVITNLQQKEKTLVQLNETVPEGSMPSICDFEFKPATPLCIYDLANLNVMPKAQFNGHEIPLLTTKGDFIVYDKDKNIKLKKYIDSMFNVSRLDWELSDKLTQNGIEKVWSKKFYLSKEDYTYTYDGTNSIYTFEFDEAEFSETGIPAKEDNIPIVTPCFYTGSNVQGWLDGRVWGGQPFPLKFSYNTETKKYIMTIRGVGDNLIKYQLQEYSKAYIYYKLETPYNKNEFLALGLEAGDTFSFIEDKTEIQPYLDATNFFRYNASGNVIDDTTNLDITPKFVVTVPQNTTTALIGFSNAAKIFNNGQTTEKEAAQDYSWIGDGDGTTDYTLLLKNKIKELSSVSNGGTIYLGNGTYKVSSFLELTDNIKLVGTGNTTIQQTNKYEHVIVISGSNITIKDLKLKLYAMTAEEKDNLQYNPELTACLYINSNNPKTSSIYNDKYLDNVYCKNLTVDNVHLSGSYGFKYIDGYPTISNDYEHYRGCGLFTERLFFNYATLTNVHIGGMYYGLHGLGGSNDITVFCESCKTMVYGNGGYANLNIYGHSYYDTNSEGKVISMSDEVGIFAFTEQSNIAEYVYDIQWMKHVFVFEGYTMNNRYLVSQLAGVSYFENYAGHNVKLTNYVIDHGRGNRQIETFQNRPFHSGNVYFDITGQTSFKNIDTLTQNAISGAGIWGNGITSNISFVGTLPLSEICRYPKEQQELTKELLSALSTTTPSLDTPIDIIIDISNKPVHALQSCFLQFDHRYIASDFTVSFDTNNDNNYNTIITASNNQDTIYYYCNHQTTPINVYKIKISITKALRIHELKYRDSNYNPYIKDYNQNELVGICNFGIISSDYNGRSFISECGGKVYGDLILNKNSTIKNIPAPTDDTDAVNKNYVDNAITQAKEPGKNNSIISDNSFVSGANNIAGGKAFKIIAEPTGTIGGMGTYKLDSVIGIQVGMTYSAVTSIAAYHQGTIQSVNSANNTVIVNNYAGYALNTNIDDSDNYNFYNTFLLDDHPELGTISIGANAAAFGQGVNAHNVATHAEGKDTRALGKFSHTEGLETIAGHASHAEGAHTKALGAATHAEGDSTISEGHYSHSEGHNSQSSGQSAHAEGENTLASGRGAHSEGENTKALGVNTHAEGFTTEASGNYSHSEGYQSKSSGFVSHAEGCRTESSGEYSHSQGNDTIALGKKAHAEGQNTLASGENAHAEGLGSNTRNGDIVTAGSTGALGKNSHSEGNTTTASGDDSHAEGWGTTASGMAAHAEGVNSKAVGAFSHSEGNASVASGPVSHAEGENTTTKAKCAHSEGRGTIASGENQHVQGKYNIEDTENKFAHIIGGGTADNNRFNIHTVDWNGNAWFAGDVTCTYNNKEYKMSDIIQALINLGKLS